MQPTNTESLIQSGAYTTLAIALDLAMEHNEMARWDYFFTHGVMYAPLCTAEQHAEEARKARVQVAYDAAAKTGAL